MEGMMNNRMSASAHSKTIEYRGHKINSGNHWNDFRTDLGHTPEFWGGLDQVKAEIDKAVDAEITRQPEAVYAGHAFEVKVYDVADNAGWELDDKYFADVHVARAFGYANSKEGHDAVVFDHGNYMGEYDAAEV